MNDLDPITTMAINDECLRLYLYNRCPEDIVQRVFPTAPVDGIYFKEKADKLARDKTLFISNLDMAHRKVLYKNAIEAYLTEATNRVMNSTY